MPNLTVRENLFLNPVAAGLSLFSLLAPGRENRAALELGQRVGLRPNDPTLPIELLSGGNQQKVVVGRWLHLAAKVYVFEDPTAGVDVGAKAEIYRLFDVALQAGAAILIVSTDFEEVAKVCHRALVFDRGRVVAELAAADLSVENLLAAASASIGHSAEAAAALSSTRPGALMQSIKSNALEPTRSELAALSRWQAIGRLAPVYGLPILTLAVDRLLLAPAARPRSRPTLNVRSILSDKAIIALLVAGRDLADDGRPHRPHRRLRHRHVAHPGDEPPGQVRGPVAAGHLIVIACGALVGLINGLLVEVAQVDSFIATLGTGTILYALALWHTDGRQIIGVLPAGFIAINTLSIVGIPIPAVYAIVLAVVLWIVSERLPIGRHIYAIGANEKAAALNGIPVRAYVIGVFVASGRDRRLRRLRARRQAQDRPGECRARLSVARARGRIPRLDDHQAGQGQYLGHDVRRLDPRRRHFRNPAARRGVLRRTPVQRHDIGHLHRAGGLRAAPAHGGATDPRREGSS